MSGGFSATDKLARLRLIRSDGVGPVSFRHLLARFGGAEAAVDALPDLARKNGAVSVVFSPEAAGAEIARVAEFGARHVFLGEADYPALLAQMHDAPPVLVVLGDVGLLNRPCVAIVGARNASAAGRGLARGIAEDLGRAGWVVVSGMARGVDAAAHGGALDTGTVACIAGGIDVVYPPENADLQHDVAMRGLVISEMPPGTEPQARHFPRRNRVIAGVARGVVVVEAALGSGSLITARIAGEAGREVMAVPGHPMDPRARGGNLLLKEGATLVEDAGDVVAALGVFARGGESPLPVRVRESASPLEGEGVVGAVTDLLSSVPVGVNEVVRLSGFDVASVMTVLVDLELEGRLVRHAGGRVALA